MKFFEIKEPYFAIVASTDKHECMALYREQVADIEDEQQFLKELKELDLANTISKVSNTVREDNLKPVGLEEAAEQVAQCVNGNEPALLALDGALV